MQLQGVYTILPSRNVLWPSNILFAISELTALLAGLAPRAIAEVAGGVTRAAGVDLGHGVAGAEGIDRIHGLTFTISSVSVHCTFVTIGRLRTA